MIETYIPDYTNYETDELIDIYVRIDKFNNPLKTKKLEEELKKRLDIEQDVPINENLIKNMYNVFHQKEKNERKKEKKYGNMIKAAWIGGLFSATYTLILLVIAVLDEQAVPIPITNRIAFLVDIFIVYGLSYGIYRKSRVCSILLLSFFTLAKINSTLQVGITLTQLSFSLLMIGIFISGLIGTFGYHKENIENQLEKSA